MPDQLQRLLGIVLSIVTLPLLALIVLAIRLECPGPGIHRAQRIGRGGHQFTCYKLRSMRVGGDDGPAVTAADDPRISRVGATLRRFRLDELPQLWNVARGEMRIVGPRPEAPQFVDFRDPLHQLVFSSKPGITGLTQLAYIDEAAMLAGPDPETTYRVDVLPAKLTIDAAYLERRSTALDLWILGRTIAAVAGRHVDISTLEARLGCSLVRVAGTVRTTGAGGEPA